MMQSFCKIPIHLPFPIICHHYLPSAALCAWVSRLSERGGVEVMALFVLEVVTFTFSFACDGCPVRISFAICWAVSLPCSRPSVAESLKWVEIAIVAIINARAIPETISIDLLFNV